MSDTRGTGHEEHDDAVPSVDQIAGLDAYLDQLVDDRQPPPQSPHADEQLVERQIAAQLRLAREDVERPSSAFLQSLEAQVGQAVALERSKGRSRGLSRLGFLRAAAAVAGGAGLGVAGVEGLGMLQDAQRPNSLVAAGNGHWYDIAAADEVQPGGAKQFTAGGIEGYLLNDNGALHAVSAICTHMGCKLKPDEVAGQQTLRCLCHESRFSRLGAVVGGLAPSPLPAVTLHLERGRVYALGTRETV